MEFAPAYHPAPPVAVDLLTDKKSALTVPLALDSVWLAAVTEPMVKSLVDSPLAFQSAKVFVVPAVNKIDAALVLLRVLVMLPNVFDPVMVNAPAPPWLSVMPEKEKLPPAKVFADALVRLIVPVPVTVSPVVVAVVHTVPVPVQVIFPVPKAIVLVSVLLELNKPVLNVKLFRSNVPLVNVVVLVENVVNASCN